MGFVVVFSQLQFKAHFHVIIYKQRAVILLHWMDLAAFQDSAALQHSAIAIRLHGIAYPVDVPLRVALHGDAGASLRCVIRRAFDFAVQAGSAAGVASAPTPQGEASPAGAGAQAYIALVDVYGLACIRLVKLLKSGESYASRLNAYVSEQIELALDEIIGEFNIGV
jgi:hypothetical protein